MNINLVTPVTPTTRIDSGRGVRCGWRRTTTGRMDDPVYQCRLGMYHNGEHDFGIDRFGRWIGGDDGT